MAVLGERQRVLGDRHAVPRRAAHLAGVRVGLARLDLAGVQDGEVAELDVRVREVGAVGGVSGVGSAREGGAGCAGWGGCASGLSAGRGDWTAPCQTTSGAWGFVASGAVSVWSPRPAGENVLRPARARARVGPPLT